MVEKFLRKHFCLVAVICLLVSFSLSIVVAIEIKSVIISWVLRITLIVITVRILMMIVTFLLLKKSISKSWYEITYSQEEDFNGEYLIALIVDMLKVSNIKIHINMDEFNVINIRFVDTENNIIYETSTDKYSAIYYLIEDAKIEKI